MANLWHFFSRTLSGTERGHPAVEKEAAVEALKKWRNYLLGKPFILITDQRSVSFMFDKQKSTKIKNDKILRWRLELAGFDYNIVCRPGSQNKPADALSRAKKSVCATVAYGSTDLLIKLHEDLCHPGIRRLQHYVKIKNLPYSIDDVRKVIAACKDCAELKPRFFRPSQARLVKATQVFERLSINFKGPHYHQLITKSIC